MNDGRNIAIIMLCMLLVSAVTIGIVAALVNGYALYFAWIWMSLMVAGLLWTRKFFH